jgi:predicted ATPase
MGTLLYLWIDKFKNLKDIGFNLSSRYSIDYKDDVLTIQESDNYIENFFGKDISDLTVIAGHNGAGKSNLLEFITLLFSQEEDRLVSYSFFALFSYHENGSKKAKLGIVHNKTKLSIHEVHSPEQPSIHEWKDINKVLDRQKLVYYSSFFDYDNRGVQNVPFGERSRNVIDISTNNMLALAGYQNGQFQENINLIERYALNEIISQVNFVIDGGLGLVDFNLPPYLILSFSENYLPENIPKLFKSYPYFNQLFAEENSFWENINKLIEKFPYESNKDKLLFSLFWAKVIESTAKYREGPGFPPLLEKCLKDLESGKSIETLFSKFNHGDEKKSEDLIEEWSKLDESLVIKVNREDASKLIPLRNILGALKSLYSVAKNFIEFRWSHSPNSESNNYGGMSYGEKIQLMLYSRLFNMHRLDEIPDATVIVLDEAELGFHPEWQRKYINRLVRYIPDFLNRIQLKKTIYSRQIIITTHSPLILSDVPKQNLILMKKNQSSGHTEVKREFLENTFGGNLHHILADEFFLEGGLIGEFAKGVIQDIIDFIDGKKQENGNRDLGSFEITEQNCLQVINMIGEPIVKQHLQRKYVEKFEKADWIDAEIERLQKLKSGR